MNHRTPYPQCLTGIDLEENPVASTDVTTDTSSCVILSAN
jgi:hypothetical protein